MFFPSPPPPFPFSVWQLDVRVVEFFLGQEYVIAATTKTTLGYFAEQIAQATGVHRDKLRLYYGPLSFWDQLRSTALGAVG